MKAVYAAVSATTFALYALAVSAASAPPSVHAAGLVLWLAHVVLIFGRPPQRGAAAATARAPGALARREALERGADAAAAIIVRRGEGDAGRPEGERAGARGAGRLEPPARG